MIANFTGRVYNKSQKALYEERKLLMVGLLAKRFIKDRENVTSPTVRQAYGMLCSIAGIFFNVLLAGGKCLAGVISGSIAIMADAANNLSDAASSVIVLIGFKMAGQKPDKDHPFGHGRIEYISGLLVSVLIIFMAWELFQSSVVKIFHPEQTKFEPLVAAILIASIFVKLYIFCYNHSIGKRIDSEAMLAASKDSISDMAATGAVLFSMFISHFFEINIDGWCGVLVALMIFYAGITSAKDTISPLLGQPPEPGFVKRVEELVMSYEEVIGIHDLIVHNYGPGRTMISLHAEVSAEGDILVLHDVIDNIERRLREEMGCEAVIHMDPVCMKDEETQRLKELVVQAAAEIAEELSVHDFRIVRGPTHTNVIFDLVIPYKFKLSDEKITEQLRERIQEYESTYYAVIEVDKEYVER